MWDSDSLMALAVAADTVMPFSQRLMVGLRRSGQVRAGLPNFSFASQYPLSSPGTPEAPGPSLLLLSPANISLVAAMGAISLATRLTAVPLAR